ncbi:MAG: pilus assembly protein [Myxococcales bacterium]
METAIVVPLMTFFILGILQLTLMHQASLMLEYAAFNAARSGAVWNMDKGRMKQAALVSLLPTMQPVRDLTDVVTGYVKAKVKDELAEQLLGMPMVDVQVLTPKKADFGKNLEIEFDAGDRKKTQMTVRVVYLYEMHIPFANFLIFESWWAQLVGQNLRGQNAALAFVDTDKLKLSRVQSGDFAKSCKYTGLNDSKMKKLRWVATLSGRYFQPLVTTYTIRMQSNPFLHKPGDSGEEWAGKDDGDDGC